ncbi:histidine phosphatase family protein [Rhizobium sp. SSA_523]|uniref:histidine phosphatase family protein n=1 Tax=Rhizobium sp. SSA_523 TaxID=2952477 RepID=UPI0020917AEE|nr:histidine phosphatase family protein [Rhizobium sp. SSA_523]MCO5732704.1 phosphoglycerate mutase family protein [Rhizobium sp. SSA_523]WKC23670.1 histidine phosphatase family protein [Rhizobium sp. SSA_523]
MFALYITHPQVKIDPKVPVPDWGLSETGAERARTASRLSWASRLQRILSSQERKAIETADILARAAGCSVETEAAMHENDRSATGFLPPPDFEAAADWFFAHPQQSFKGWETAQDAQHRIVDAVSRVLQSHDCSRPIAFVGHGGVGTLLKCHISGNPIARDRDQPAGGGNLFAFTLSNRLADCRLTCDWTPMDAWQGEMA